MLDKTVQHDAHAPCNSTASQTVHIGEIRGMSFCVQPIADSPITRAAFKTGKPIAHLRVLSGNGDTFTEEDLRKMALKTADIIPLRRDNLDLLRRVFLPRWMRGHAQIAEERLCIDDEGVVHMTFILCERGVKLSLPE